jgi:TolB protein
MTTPNGIDRRLSAWLDEQAPTRAPDHLLRRVTDGAARTRHRPAWATSERWIPMETRARFGAVPRAVIILVTLALLTVALGIAIALAAKPTSRLPEPLGQARNGLITYDSGGDIWVAGPDGSDPHAVTSGPERDISPVFSPDGTRMAFWSRPAEETRAAYEAAPSNLVVADADGQNRVTLASDLVVHAVHPAAWSPNGERILLQMQERGQDVIAVVDVATGEPTVLTRGYSPAWSPDSDRVVFNGASLPDPGVYVIDAAGGDPTKISHVEGDNFGFPAWQPRGTSIGYFLPNDPEGDIWVVDDDGTNERNISNSPAQDMWPIWSPDGTRIAYDRWDEELSGNHLVIVDPDGSNELVLDGPIVDGNHTWSPDGKHVFAWALNWTGGAILVFDVTNAEPPLVITTRDNVGMGSWQWLTP